MLLVSQPDLPELVTIRMLADVPLSYLHGRRGGADLRMAGHGRPIVPGARRACFSAGLLLTKNEGMVLLAIDRGRVCS